MSSFLKRHIEGPGGIRALLAIAFPMFLSSMFDMLMMFIDRLFLSRVGVVHQAAAMSGGVTSWMVASFFAGIVGYSSALVAQYYGAKQWHNCGTMVRQGVLLGIFSYPLVLLVDFLVLHCGVFHGHTTNELVLETRYFWYMAFGSIISLMRFAYGSFFTGIGQTKVLLMANLVALFVNVFANWVLIFGHLGCPALGLDGAAIGTLIAGVSTAIILILRYTYVKQSRPEWKEKNGKFLDWEKLFKLIRYGTPQGAENVFSMLCFVFLVSGFHSYGEDVATATTICFNWDGFSFHPLLGIQIGVTTLVGQAMGKGDPELAVRSAQSGFKVALLYAASMVVFFFVCAPALVGVFAPEDVGLDYTKVREYGVPMLRLASLYLLSDAILLISSGTLRGAGDTFWCMIMRLCTEMSMSAAVLFCAHVLRLPPMQVWFFFVLVAVFNGMAVYTRYRLGRWKKLRIIEA